MSSDLYSDLELQRGASADDARKAYLKLSRKYHPDKGGSEDKFKSIQRAYEVLGDEKKKGLYLSLTHPACQPASQPDRSPHNSLTIWDIYLSLGSPHQ